MTTSFTRTREQLRTMVLNKVIQLGSATATSADSDTVYEAIDLRLKEMHRLGVYWRKVNKTPLSFTITANTSSASASADILFPIAMQVLDGSSDYGVQIIDIREYAAIPNKADTGVPTKALWNGSAEFIFWPVPTATTTAKLTYEKIADDTSAGSAIDVDVSMLRWIRDMVAYDIGDYFGVPDGKMLRWMKESEMAEKNIRKLAVQNVDFSAVAVDNFDNAIVETDYNRYR